MTSGESRPFDSLNASVGSVVIIRLKDGQELRGTLKAFDVHMNLVLEQAEEVTDSNTKRFGTIVVRGDNIIFISPATNGSKN